MIDEGLDTGDIVAQQALTLPDGISGEAAEQQCARLGNSLLAAVVDQLWQGEIMRQPQHGEHRYYGWPTAESFAISPDWTARHAFNFMRGTDSWHHPYTVTLDGRVFALGTALSFDPDGSLEAPFKLSGQEITLQLNPGVLRAALIEQQRFKG
jgi:methionyl-tRNA formyltransferase